MQNKNKKHKKCKQQATQRYICRSDCTKKWKPVKMPKSKKMKNNIKKQEKRKGTKSKQKQQQNKTIQNKTKTSKITNKQKLTN